MKFCTHCGKEVLDDAVICPNCGCSVQYDAPAQANPAPHYTAPVPAQDTYSTMSIVGLILSFFTALIGLIVSVMAYNEAKQTGSAKSKSMAKAGIIIGAIEMGLGLLSGIILGVVWAIILGAASTMAII